MIKGIKLENGKGYKYDDVDFTYIKGGAIYAYNNAEDNLMTLMIDNCKIVNNTLTADPSGSFNCFGGGVFIKGHLNSNNGVRIRVTNCIISDNEIATSDNEFCYCLGGGIYCDCLAANSLIKSNLIENNIAEDLGGGMILLNSESVTVDSNQFYCNLTMRYRDYNASAFYAGEFDDSEGSLTFTNNIIAQNDNNPSLPDGSHKDAVVMIDIPEIAVINNTIAKNKCQNGHAIIIGSDSYQDPQQVYVYFYNNIIHKNLIYQNDYQLAFISVNDAEVHVWRNKNQLHNDSYGNMGNYVYIEEHQNNENYPEVYFVEEHYSAHNFNFHLTNQSPCVDRGADIYMLGYYLGSLTVLETGWDIDGDNRPLEGNNVYPIGYDMGADEHIFEE